MKLIGNFKKLHPIIIYVKNKDGGVLMGLKFEKTDDLDKLFESFVVDPEKKVQKNEEIDKFLKPKTETTDKKKDQV